MTGLPCLQLLPISKEALADLHIQFSILEILNAGKNVLEAQIIEVIRGCSGDVEELVS